MALPLPSLTFYRLADVTVGGSALVSEWLDAVYTAMTATVDYRGNAIASTHLWPTTRKRPTVVTEALDIDAPSGTAMAKSPRILVAGRISAAGTMATPDSSATLVPQIGINKNGGAYSDWTAALPYGSGSWFGFWRMATTAATMGAGCVIRVFLSQETIFFQIIQSAAVQYWGYIGAIIEPFTNDTTNAAETDNRLYGMFVCGSTSSVSANFLSEAVGGILSHSGSASAAHGGVFVPNTGSIQAIARLETFAVGANAGMIQDPSGAYVGARWTAYQFAGSGNRVGTIRGLFPSGLVQSGKYLRNGSTDLYHFVGMDTSLANDAIILPAAA